nr:glycine-rich protein [Cohnella mopanensis]
MANPDYVAASVSPPSSVEFGYTGVAQTFTASSTGLYTLETWGASGGNGTYTSNPWGGIATGGKGSYATGKISLMAGEKLEVYVGGAGRNASIDTGGCGAGIGQNKGGFNGGGGGGNYSGSGGGATDIRSSSNKLIVAGGGGGAGQQSFGGDGDLNGDGYNSSKGAGGGGAKGIYATGLGGDGHETDDGGGGGGWYGGAGGSTGCGGDSGGGGGTSYVGSLSSSAIMQGNLSFPAPGGGNEIGHSGNGYTRISTPGANIPEQGTPTIGVQVVAAGGSSAIPADAYIKVSKDTEPNAGAGGFTPGNFILLDYGFRMYFPNTGDFYGNGANGISSTTSIRGKGFVDNMDTTEWTKEKYVKFQFDVIYSGVLFKKNTWIQLNVPTTTFDFYTPLENKEKISALVEWKSIAINAPYEDNDTPTNRIRYDNYAARHSTLKRFNIDLVGRIGNMMMEDTGDFRFSNFFKKPAVPEEWFIPNVVPKVDQTRQKFIIGDRIDIRANPVSVDTNYLDTWGLLPHARQVPVEWPLSPEKNNITAFKKQPMRIGYNAFTDIQTMGNYYSKVQIIPYYYALNLLNGDIQPVDIYMKVNGSYQPINKFGAAKPDWDPTTIYKNPVAIDWESEASRRNVTQAEQENTDAVTNYALGGGDDAKTGKAAGPTGYDYIYGTTQIMNLNGRNRTYIGQTNTYGEDKNPGNKIPSLMYAQQAQRWHFHMGLPSSAVAVPKGAKPTQASIQAIAKNTMVLLMAADIKSVGDTYVLQYSNPNGNGDVNIDGINSWPTTSIPYPIMAVYSANKSSALDLDTFGTH